MPWLSDLTAETLEPFEEYDAVAVVGRTFSAQQCDNLILTECWLGDSSFEGTRMARLRIVDSVLDEVRMVATDLTDSQWRDTTIHRGVLAGAQLPGALLDRVTVAGCKLAGVNLRGAHLRSVRFDDCTLTDLDLNSAMLKDCVFRSCRITGLDLTAARLSGVDLRGCELDLSRGHSALPGAILEESQLLPLATHLAADLGIDVRPDGSAPAG